MRRHVLGNEEILSTDDTIVRVSIAPTPRSSPKAEPSGVAVRRARDYGRCMSAQQALEARAVTVPFIDLSYTHAPLKARLLDDIGELFDSAAFINGPAVAEFENEFASYCGGPHCVGVASGLDALRLGLLAIGLQPDDEVIVPAMTFVATLEAVTQAGGVPVVVDISPDDYCLDVAASARAVGERTRALIPVHLYGQVADMHRVRHSQLTVASRSSRTPAKRTAPSETASAPARRVTRLHSASTLARTSAQPAMPGRSSLRTRR